MRTCGTIVLPYYFCFVQTSWLDVVEPLDIEQEIEAQIEATVGKDDCIKNLADFPVDDIQVLNTDTTHFWKTNLFNNIKLQR